MALEKNKTFFEMALFIHFLSTNKPEKDILSLLSNFTPFADFHFCLTHFMFL